MLLHVEEATYQTDYGTYVGSLAEHCRRCGTCIWGEFLAADLAEDKREILRRHERTGRPLGSQAFVEQIGRMLGRDLRASPEAFWSAVAEVVDPVERVLLEVTREGHVLFRTPLTDALMESRGRWGIFFVSP